MVEKTPTALQQPTWWALLMLILAIAYLIPEAIFNAQLVNAAGGMDAEHARLKQVEFFGRWISGIGASILIADLLLRGAILQNKGKAIGYLIGITLLVWPVVFFGQKVLVEKLLIESSSAEQRQQAYFSQLVRSGMARNALQIEGISYDPDNRLEPSERVFLSLLSGLAYADPSLLEVLRNQKEQIISSYITKRVYDDFEIYYGDFTRLRDRLRESYRLYADGSMRFNKGLDDSGNIADEQWKQVNSYILNGWDEYQKAIASYESRAAARAEELAPQLYKLFQRKSSCHADFCRQQQDSEYTRLMKRYGLNDVPQSVWTEEQQGSDAGGLLQCMTKKCSYKKGFNLFGDRKVSVLTDHHGHYRIIILKLMQPEFERQAGYPMGISTTNEFYNHAVTAQKVIKHLSGSGISLPSSWKITDREIFNQRVSEKVRSDTNTKWRSEMAGHNIDLPPNLSWREFQLHPSTQSRIKDAMGEDYYVAGMLMDWNNAQFKELIIEPNIRRLTRETIAYLDANLQQYADNGELEQQGKDALRSTLIPPISMVLSLLLVLLTIIKIPQKIWLLLSSRIHTDTQASGQPSLHKRMIPHGVFGITVLILFIVPLTTFSNPYTEKDSTVKYFLNQVNEHSSPIYSLALEWALLTQPKVYPIGQSLEELLGLINLVIPSTSTFEAMDYSVLALFGDKDSTSHEKGEIPDKLPLIITSNVDKPTIRVMNIAPRYYSGIMLDSNKSYDIEVSKPGYVTKREWVLLNQSNQVFRVILTEE